MEAESPTIWHLQVGDPRNLKGWEPGSQWYKSMSQGSRTRNFDVWKQEKDFPAPSRDQVCSFSTFFFFFLLFKPPLDWMMPICIGGGWSSVYWFKCQSLPETTSQTHPEMIFYLLSEHPLALSSWHKKFNSYIEKYAQESGRKWGIKTWLQRPMLRGPI